MVLFSTAATFWEIEITVLSPRYGEGLVAPILTHPSRAAIPLPKSKLTRRRRSSSRSSSLRSAAIVDLRAARARDPACVSFSITRASSPARNQRIVVDCGLW